MVGCIAAAGASRCGRPAPRRSLPRRGSRRRRAAGHRRRDPGRSIPLRGVTGAGRPPPPRPLAQAIVGGARVGVGQHRVGFGDALEGGGGGRAGAIGMEVQGQDAKGATDLGHGGGVRRRPARGSSPPAVAACRPQLSSPRPGSAGSGAAGKCCARRGNVVSSVPMRASSNACAPFAVVGRSRRPAAAAGRACCRHPGGLAQGQGTTPIGTDIGKVPAGAWAEYNITMNDMKGKLRWALVERRLSSIASSSRWRAG